jgi:hypothetical protein
MANIFPKKYMSKIKDLPGFVDGIEGASTEEIKAKILLAEGHLYEIELEKEKNERLKELKEELKYITGPISEAKGIETAKIKYCIFMLEERGIEI